MEKHLTLLTLADKSDGIRFTETRAVVVRETEKMVIAISERADREWRILKRKLDVITDNSDGTHYIMMKTYTMTDEGVKKHKENMVNRLNEHLTATKKRVSDVEAFLSKQ